jgi:hypothetical protein
VTEISDLVSDQPTPVVRHATDLKAAVLRAFILLVLIAGAYETIIGLRAAWKEGVAADLALGRTAQQAWGLSPFVALLALSAFRVSKRSLATLLVTSLLCWFMSTGYFNLSEMGMGVLTIPFIQFAFIGGALIVMFTFWLLRTRPNP